MKLIASLILSLFFATNVNAYTIEMFGKDTYGFDMPRYKGGKRAQQSLPVRRDLSEYVYIKKASESTEGIRV